MDLSKNHEEPVFKELMKQFRFYQVFESDTKKIFNCNVYKLVHFTIVMFVQVFHIIVAIGFFWNTRNDIQFLDVQVAIFGYINTVLTSLKVSILLYKADEITNFIDLTKCNLLKSKLCCKQIFIIYKFRDFAMKFIKLFYSLYVVVIIIWFLFPLAWNHFVMSKDSDLRYQNIYNMPYPISKKNYNQYYYIFYFIEFMVEIYVSYYTGLTDFLIYSCCWITIAQHKMLIQSFKSIGHDWKPENFENSKYHNIQNSII